MFRKPLKFVVTAAGVAMLAGCANMLPSMPLAERAPLVGRAFYLKSVSVSPNVTPKAGEKEDRHCLPDYMYADMLSQQLGIAFAHAGLNNGVGPALPVRVVIYRREFTNEFGFSPSSQLYALLYVADDAPMKTRVVDMGIRGYFDWVSNWRKEQTVTPTLAVVIANGLIALREGKDFQQQPHKGIGIMAVNVWTDGSAPKDGLRHPEPLTAILSATGKTANQLTAICKANEARG